MPVKRKRKPKAGPLSALGWKRAFFHPKTGKELPGNWVYPNNEALSKVGTLCVQQTSRKAFRDTKAGEKAARKAGLI